MILGLDPSTKIIGYALYGDWASGSPRIEEIGKFELKDKELQNRYKQATEHIKFLLETRQPDYVGIETSFFGRNAGVAIKLGVVRGIITGLVYTLTKARLFEVTPAEERMALGLDTRKHADKSEIRKALEWQFKELKGANLTEDELDALAVAIATRTKIKIADYKLKAQGGEKKK